MTLASFGSTAEAEPPGSASSVLPKGARSGAKNRTLVDRLRHRVAVEWRSEAGMQIERYVRRCRTHRRACVETSAAVRCPLGHRVESWEVFDIVAEQVVALVDPGSCRLFEGFAERAGGGLRPMRAWRAA